MIVHEEYCISTPLVHSIAHARLTQNAFTVSLLLMRWVTTSVPLTSIREIQLVHPTTAHEITVRYEKPQVHLNEVTFFSRDTAAWQQAFESVGLRVVAHPL